MIGSADHGSDRAVTDGGKDAFYRVGRANVVPVLGGKVEEGEQPVPIFDEALDSLIVFRAVFLGKDVDRARSRRSIGSRPDLAQIMLDLVMDRLRFDSFADRILSTFAVLCTVHR